MTLAHSMIYKYIIFTVLTSFRKKYDIEVFGAKPITSVSLPEIQM
jgi:hypothetical protein